MTMKPFHSNIQNPNDHEVIMNFEYYEAQLKRLEVEEKKLELSTRLKFNAQQQQFRLDQERIQLLKSLLVTAVNEENCNIFNSDNKAMPVFDIEECNFMRKKVLDILKRWQNKCNSRIRGLLMLVALHSF